jgi:hypothetical protein
MNEVEVARQAALNNATWCNTICTTHGAPGVFEGSVWFTKHATPPYYPNLVTLSPDAVDEQLQRVDEIVDTIGRDQAVGIKDSFSRLDLSSRGFAPIIEAEWYAFTKPGTGNTAADVESIADAAALVEWEAAWSASSPNETRMFKPELLVMEDVLLLAERESGQVRAGVVANLSAGIVGISNLFVPPKHARAFVLSAVSVLQERFGSVPVVGYSGGVELQFMQSVGFESLGPLKVWVRPAGA